MKILVVDNYDSFTFNLVQQLGTLNCKVIVGRNDKLSTKAILKLNPDKILISPGPKRPEDSKNTLEIIREFYTKIPILGVCLGHQAIALVFGGKVIKALKPMHGLTTKITHDGKSIFTAIRQNLNVMRYHSLIVEKQSFPNELEVTAQSDDGIIMALRHKSYPIEGIQFHPESILTESGNAMITNWIKS